MKKYSRISELIKEVISEQGKFNPPPADAKYGNSVGPGTTFQKGSVQPSITMPSNLFKNGIDKIDVNSSSFKEGVAGIQKAVASKGPNVTINVIGGASAVGSKEGYDNNSLAQRRAQNFVNIVKKQFPSVNFKIGTKVGVETVKNSAKAESEQFVKLTFPGSVTADKVGAAVDNTQLVMNYRKNPKPAEETTINKKTYYKVCYWIPKEKYSEVMAVIRGSGAIDV